MKVINLQGNNHVLIIDDTTGQYFEWLMPKDVFQKTFGINLNNVLTFTYEPERKMFFIEYSNAEIKKIEEPSDNIVLRQIHSKETEIISAAREKSFKKRLPKYHTLKMGEPYLPEELEEDFQEYIARKKAMARLKNSAWFLALAKEFNIDLPEDFRQRVEEYIQTVGVEEIQKIAKIDIGFAESPGSVQKAKAGIKPEPL